MRKISDLSKYVIFSLSFVILYTVIEFVASTRTGVMHDTLTTCVYAFFAGEVTVCGLIKIFKIKEEDNE